MSVYRVTRKPGDTYDMHARSLEEAATFAAAKLRLGPAQRVQLDMHHECDRAVCFVRVLTRQGKQVAGVAVRPLDEGTTLL